MPETSIVTLPVLPLRSGVVFPHMVLTVAIESAEAKRALAAAETTGGRLLLVPQIEGEYARVGTIAEIQEVSRGDATTALISGVARAEIGAGRPGGQRRSRSPTYARMRTNSAFSPTRSRGASICTSLQAPSRRTDRALASL